MLQAFPWLLAVAPAIRKSALLTCATIRLRTDQAVGGAELGSFGELLRRYRVAAGLTQDRSRGLAVVHSGAQREFPDSDGVVSALGLSITNHASQYWCTSACGISRRALRLLKRFNGGEACTPNTDSWEADAMRKLTFAMNLSLDGYITAPGDDLGWSVPSDELFQWWSDRVAATGLALYGRKLWETMSSHWPTADQQPGATPAQMEFARRWRDMPKVVFSSTTSAVDWNARLVTGDPVTEITRLKTEDGGRMDRHPQS
jgi:dihydrofolate reductase